MAIAHRIAKLVKVEILGEGSCAEAFTANVYGIRTALNGGKKRLEAACGRKKIGEVVRSFHSGHSFRFGFIPYIVPFIWRDVN